MLDRNAKCRCGSGIKYKRCCLELDERASRSLYNNVVLFVGNGLTISFLREFFDIKKLNPSVPLRHFDNEDITFDDFINKMPDIEKHLMPHKDDNNFEAITKYIDCFGNDIDKDCQLRRFLAVAYSQLQLKMDTAKEKYWEWCWTRWLSANGSKLSSVVSLNYDLLLENILNTIGISYFRVGSTENGELPVIKPHGSIDFDTPSSFIEVSVEGRWGVATKLNDIGFVSIVPQHEWLIPRTEADIIPPNQMNYQQNLGWVLKGRRYYNQIAGKIDAMIIFGFRYSDADKKEFNQLVENLPEGKAIDFYNINPGPSQELKDYLVALGHNVIEVKEGTPW